MNILDMSDLVTLRELDAVHGSLISEYKASKLHVDLGNLTATVLDPLGGLPAKEQKVQEPELWWGLALWLLSSQDYAKS